MCRHLRLAVALAIVARVATLASGADVPRPAGFVTDLADVLPAATERRITALAEELQAKTGAEIAVLTVETTAPLDDFTYAMQVADAWKPGRKREDTGVVFLVAVKDRKVRILVGYGLEGILPDGRVGALIDEEVLPSFRAGRLDEGIARGVEAVAGHVAAARGVTLTGVAPRRARPAARPIPWQVVLLLLLLLLVFVAVSGLVPARQRRRGFRRGRGFPYGGWGGGGGWDRDFGGGGFGGGGGGFGGFGGGGFGGGGAGRSW
jgi:uncharacterized protein